MNISQFKKSKFISNLSPNYFIALLHIDNSIALIDKSKIPDSNSIILTNISNKKRYYRNIKIEQETNETNFFIFYLF